MRLAAQLNLGFYPADPAAVRALATHLRAPEPTAILDPCAGKGEAVAGLAAGLGLGPRAVYAIELEAGRADACRDRLPGSAVLGPASALAADVSRGAFGLVYCNPPFDDELGGGGREEVRWAGRAADWLVPGGVLALVVPERVGNDDRLRRFLDGWFDDLGVFRFPPAHRPFYELCILGRRRRHADSGEDGAGMARCWPYFYTPRDEMQRARRLDREHEQPAALGAGDGPTWTVPAAPGPRRFVKRDLTDQEIVAAVARSPVHRTLLAPARPRPRVRPPLPPNDGHMAVLIAGGHLDGPVYPPGEPPHVVRGAARKEKFLSARETTKDDDGKESTVETWAERVVNTVRTVGPDGLIRTFEQ